MEMCVITNNIENRKDNPVWVQQSQDEDKQNKKHNTEN